MSGKISRFNFKGKRALIRVDFNVPLSPDRKIIDNTRIKAALPTINKILELGGSVVLMSHLGRPKGKVDLKFSLDIVAKELEDLLSKKVIFINDCIGEEVKYLVKKLLPGEIILLENLRFYEQETKGDLLFAKELSSMADVYINEAYGTAHRNHASTCIVAKYFDSDHKMRGYLLSKEVEIINRIFKEARPPVLAIIGGAKISSKINILKNLLKLVDYMVIGGAMLYTFVKAQGGDIGDSLYEKDFLKIAKDFLEQAKQHKVKIILSQDSVIADNINNPSEIKVSLSNKIPRGFMGLDIGPKASIEIKKVIKISKTIIWNGPMGVFERPDFSKGTEEIVRLIAESTVVNDAFSLVGGGDSISAVNKVGLEKSISHISTGGGAMLEQLEGKILPAVEALN